MVAILQEDLSPRAKFGAGLGQGLAGGLSQTLEKLSKQKEMESTLQALGLNVSGTGQRMAGGDQGGIGEISPQQLLGASLTGNKELASSLGTIYQTQQKQSAKREEREHQASQKTLEGATKAKEDLIGQQSSLDIARQAIETGDEGGFKALLADAIGLPALKNATWSAIDATAKTHLLSAMGNLSGGKPNQFLERQISQAFALPGGSKEANLAKLEILKTMADMKQAQVDGVLKLAEQYEEKGLPVPGNIGRVALKNAIPEIEKRQKIASYRMQNLLEPSVEEMGGQKIKKVKKGTPLTRKRLVHIFQKTNKGSDINRAKEEEINEAFKVAKDLGYDLSFMDLEELGDE